jgi:hypothetical protein
MESFAFEGHVVRLYRDGTSEVIVPEPGPPQRIEGFTVGAEVVSGASPHRGELHPDGDELLFVITGRMDVISTTATRHTSAPRPCTRSGRATRASCRAGRGTASRWSSPDGW